MNGHRVLQRIAGAYVAYSNIARNSSNTLYGGFSNFSVMNAVAVSGVGGNVVSLSGFVDRTKHAEKKAAFAVVEGSPEVQKGKFVGVINELRDAWLAARGSRRP